MGSTNTTFINKFASRLAIGSAACLAISFAGPSFAQESSSGQVVLDEIIITAQKREQTLQDVPAAVSAISGETVRDYLGSAENVRALANRVPSLNISNRRTAAHSRVSIFAVSATSILTSRHHSRSRSSWTRS